MVKQLGERQRNKDLLLKAILPHVGFDGWTEKALKAAVNDAGLEEMIIELYFIGGVKEIVEHFSDWADREMLRSLSAFEMEDVKIRERIALAIRLRFEVLSNYKEAVRRTITYLSVPSNIPMGVNGAYKTVDSIWYGIGDRSADFSFYTKRALLYGVISATTLFWLNDQSKDNTDTWAFLDRRISDVMKINSLRSRIDKLCVCLPDPFKVLRALRER